MLWQTNLVAEMSSVSSIRPSLWSYGLIDEMTEALWSACSSSYFSPVSAPRAGEDAPTFGYTYPSIVAWAVLATATVPDSLLATVGEEKPSRSARRFRDVETTGTLLCFLLDDLRLARDAICLEAS